MAPPRDGRPRGASRLASGLGWFSLGLGAAQLAAPGPLNRLTGVRDDARNRLWQRLVGLQELGAAGGIFGSARPVPVLWARTAADVLHLTMLARARGQKGADPARIAGAMASVAGTFAADAFASARMTRDPDATREGAIMNGKATITVGVPREEASRRYAEWVRQPDGGARLAPLEIVDEQAGRSVSWQTTKGSDARGSGVVTFTDAPGDRGTELHVEVEVVVTGGSLGAAVQKVTGDEPLQVVQDDLRRFKQVVETGEIARSDGAPTGHSAKLQPKQRPAQPLEHATA